MNSPTADDAGFDFVTENGEVDTLAFERGKASEEKKTDGVDGGGEVQTKSDELEQKNAVARQQVDAVALERPFDAHKAFQQTQLKLEEYQDEQRQNLKEICIQMGKLKKLFGPAAVASGEEHRKQLTELETLRAQMAKVEGLHKMQKQHEAQMLLRMDKLGAAFLALTPQNRWDADSCAKVFTLVEPERLIVIRGGDYPILGNRSVFAEMPIPKKDIGIFYFELKIGTDDDKISNLSIGLSTKQMPLNFFGIEKSTYAYGNHGQFWCHDEEIETPAYKPFDVGDVVGCGVNLATRRIIFTLNGGRLDTANLFVDSADDLSDLFPCVTLFSPGNKIEANFGPIFTFDIVDGI